MAERLGPVQELVAALRQFRALTDPAGRAIFLDLLRIELGDAPLPVQDHRSADYFLLELAPACLRSEQVLGAVREVLFTMVDSAGVMEPFDAVVARLTARPALTAAATERLRVLLSGLQVKRLTRICQESVSPFQPAPQAADPWQAFQELSRLSTEPDRLPPQLAFVERLAAEAPFDQAGALRAWADEQAAALELTAQLRSLRQSVAQRAPEPFDAYLVVRLLPQDEPGRYLLTSWRSHDPERWRPVAGPSEYVTRATAERAVRRLVHEAEEEWAKDARDIHLEFLLAAEDLDLPVHLWLRDADTDVPVPLGMAYPVVVRSLERSRNPLWRRWWRSRWRMMDGAPERCRQLVVDGTDPETAVPGEPQALVARLVADPCVVSLVLGAPPGRTVRGGHQARAAWTAGLPVIIWDRRDRRSDELVEEFGQFTAGSGGSLARLRDGVTKLRVEAHTVDSAVREQHLGRHVVLCWDDPTRPVEAHEQLAGPD
ncbi:hypothetical protein IHE55_01850 [Streptomyces pactum]|uniref:Uncharacterized protein n=1 Tax=Streptomyces pactum TaxID=68249 RepID=A0ABS0NEN0_9ACTN|nr:hypothetical protein [Streptomyces pactum]MBH5333616.1 hypothetical protein [Streptomyces pactum]